jgi:glutaredoxin
MFKKLLLILLVVAVYQGWKQAGSGSENARVAVHQAVIMYSLTTCGYCKARGRELEAAGIPFREYYIDKDRERRDELQAKLQQAGYPPRGYGTPIMDVHGWVLPNNPSLERIRDYMGKES